MENQIFSVQKQIFELEAFTTQHTHNLHNRISDLVHYRLTQQIENYFAEVIPENLLLRMDQLVLDIGQVSLDSLEEEIEERVLRLLKDEFSLRLQLLKDVHNASFSGIRIETITTGKLELLEYFLINGALPWYTESTRNFHIDHLVEFLYDSDKAALKEVIKRTGKNVNVRKRISYQFSEESIHKLIQTVEPVEAEYIFQTHSQITELQKNSQVIHTEAKEFESAVWYFILNYLLAEMGSEFSKKMFVKSSLASMARHFNISYHYMLDIFYSALEVESAHPLYTPIRLVIHELVADDSEFITGTRGVEKMEKEFDTDTERIIAEIELLQYYFRFGTLPHDGAKMAEAGLAELFLKVAKVAPSTVREMLVQVSAGGFYSLLQQLPGASAFKDIACLLFSERKDELTEIASTFHAISGFLSFINSNENEFKVQVWKYLLDTLLSAGNSELSEGEIINAVIKKLGMQYGISTDEILDAVEKALQKRTPAAPRYDSVAKSFRDVLDSIRTTVTVNEHAAFTLVRKPRFQHRGAGEGRMHRAVQLLDLLGYLLKYGNIPWWGRSFYPSTIAGMMQALYELEPKATALLLREASLFPQMKERLLSNTPMQLIRAILSELSNSKDAVVHIDEFLLLLDASNLMRFQHEAFAPKIIFSIGWQVLTDIGYASFPGAVFYIQSILHLSGMLGLEPEEILLRLKQSQEKVHKVADTENTPSLLDTVQHYFYGLKKTQTNIADELNTHHEDLRDGVIRNGSYKEGPVDFALFLNKQPGDIQRYFPGGEMSTAQALSLVSDTLHFYLYRNRLPDSFGIMEGADRREMLKDFLLVMFRYEPIFLNTLLQDESNSAIARMSLNELFSESAGEGEKEIYIYLSQNNLPHFKRIPDEERGGNEVHLSELSNYALDLSNFFFDEKITDEKKPAAFIQSASRRIIEYFLKYNKLPDDVAIKATQKENLLLRSILFFLFSEDRAFIRELFRRHGLSLEAKLHMYDILATSNDAASDELARFIEPARDSDFLQLLTQKQLIKEQLNEKELAWLITDILQNNVTQEDKKIKDLLSSPWFAKMVVDKLGLALFLKMVAHRINPSEYESSIIKSWFTFIQETVPAAPEREKIMTLFKRFNIIFISGSLNINNERGYTSEFIKYLSAYLNANDIGIYKMLLNYISLSHREPILLTDDQKILIRQLLLPVITRLEETVVLNQLIKENESKNLSLALKEEINIYRKRQSDMLKKEAENRSKNKVDEEQRNYKKFQDDDSESIYIANAGLVLFHPFLETFFSRTGLVSNGRFIDVESRNRSILLMQYLANGRTQHEEHELVLNKILCNVPAAEAIPIKFFLTQQEIDVSEELFRVLIERWPKMKNSSVENLQAAFILREGMLKMVNDNWYMKVEHKGYDILLQNYPWAFGSIKTPWMENSLIVEWI